MLVPGAPRKAIPPLPSRDYAAEGLSLFHVRLGFAVGGWKVDVWAKGWQQAINMALADARMLSPNPAPQGELLAQSAIKVS